MATSGSKTINVLSWYSLKFSWWQNSQSVANNTTTIGWKLEFISGNGDLYVYGKPWEVTVDGQKYSGTANILIGENSSTEVASGTTVIQHANDGTKTFAYSFGQTYNITLNNGTWMGSFSGSGSATLETIARASQPSLVTWPETTNDVGDFGETFSIHMNRKSNSFTHTVRYEYGSRTGTIASGVTTGTTWAVPLSFMNDIPDAVSASGRIYVDTYNGSTLIGTKYTGFTVTVPATVKPTVTAVLDDTTGVDDIYGSPVRGLSKIKVTATATPAYGSPIVSYVIVANGVRYTVSTITTDFLNMAGSSPVTVTVTDQRGRTGTWSYTMTVKDYNGPVVTKLTVHRCTADGTEDDQGEYAKVTVGAQVAAMDNKNTATYTLRYKKTSVTGWTSMTLSALANDFEVADYSYVFAADGNSTYNVEIIAADRHGSTTAATSVSTAFTLINWHQNGNSIRFGGVAERSYSFQNDLQLIQTGNRYAAFSAGVSGQAGYVLVAKIEVTAANADTPITFVLSRRAAATTMTVWVRLNNATATASALSTIQYEGANYGAFLVKVGELTWDLYVQKGSAYDTIAVQDWFTSATMSNRVEVTFPGTLVSAVPEPFYRATPAKPQSLLDYIYPVGSIYLSYNHTNPGTLFGGTWTRIQNAFLWAVGADGTIGQTGGASEVTLTTDQIPSHDHVIPVANTATGSIAAENKIRFNNNASSFVGAVKTDKAGGGKAHNNMPPYIQVSAWRRTA